MLGHSPPLPICVHYRRLRLLSISDEEGALLALQKHDRVRSIRLCSSPRTLTKLFAAMNGLFPMLEELVLIANDHEDEVDYGVPCPLLPGTFQAPHLSYLNLIRVGDVLEEGLPLLASHSGLVSLELSGIPDYRYLPIEYLASRLSLMPRLEYLGLRFNSFRHDKRMLDRALGPDVEQILHPSLNRIVFRGNGYYLEDLVARIGIARLASFNAVFLEEPSPIHPYLCELLSAAEGLKFPVASIKLSRMYDPKVVIRMAGTEETLDRDPELARFQMTFNCESLSMQAARTGELCAALAPMFSAVKRLHLDFDFEKGYLNPAWEEVNIEPSRWHDLLRPFRNVLKLQVDVYLMDNLSHALHPDDDGRSVEEILPELRKLVRPPGPIGYFDNAFDGFIAARRDMGRHVVKRQRLPIPLSRSGKEEVEDESDSELGTDTEFDSDTDFFD